MTPIFIRTWNNYDRDIASDDSGLECKDKSLTRQEFAEEVDINTIIRKFGLDGEMPENIRMPTSGDFTNVPTFMEAMNAIRAATEAFDAMPARVRAEFHNDPAEFVAFCDDPKNRQRAADMGLLDPEKWATFQAAEKQKQLDILKQTMQQSPPSSTTTTTTT